MCDFSARGQRSCEEAAQVVAETKAEVEREIARNITAERLRRAI